VFAFRAEWLRHLLNLPSFRAYSRMLASSDLLADFCGILTIERIKWSSNRLSEHARRHRDKLATCDLDQVKWSQREISKLLARIDEKLELLAKAIEQAHERIIGGRRIAMQDKVLSAHEADQHVIGRGKAGKEVEFGNPLFISETQGGFICDYQLYQERAPGDTKELVASLGRIESYQLGQSIKEVVGDRGFDTKAFNKALQSKFINNSICPKSPQRLEQKLSQPQFRKSQKRRGGTEARIAILSNNGGRVCRNKGFEHRSEQIGWGVFAHNIHWIARKVHNQRKDDQKKAA